MDSPAETAPPVPETASTDAVTPIDPAEFDRLKARISELEAELAKKSSLPVEQPIAPASSGRGQELSAGLSPNDPSAGFVNDAAVNQFQKALLFLRSNQTAEASLEFAAFLERYPDHPWAGSAQYHLGECYFLQKNYPLAEQELQKVVTSYERSSHIAAALRRLSEAEDLLKKPESAARHRQMLLALFPHSPFAEFVPVRAAAPLKTKNEILPALESDSEVPAQDSGLDAPPVENP